MLDFIGAMDDGGGCDNWSYKLCNAAVKFIYLFQFNSRHKAHEKKRKIE